MCGRYGASGDQHKPALDVILDTGNHYAMLKVSDLSHIPLDLFVDGVEHRQDELNVSPEYPYDVDGVQSAS